MARVRLSFIINLLILLLTLSIQASGAPHFINYYCTTDNNFTENSFYKTYLNQLLPSLTSQASSNTFYNLTTGSDPNKVYGLYYCRGDLTVQDCNDCIKASADEIVSLCPVQKEAIVWYRECTLRYSNRSIFSVYDENGPWNVRYSLINVSNPGQFLTSLANIVDQLTQQAVTNTISKNYAKGKIEVTDSSQTIYCLVQCTPDLNSTQCNRCLQDARSNLRYSQSGSSFSFITFASCQIIYDIIPFGPGEVREPSPSPTTDQSPGTKPNHTPPPPSGRGKDAKFNVLAISVGVAAAAILLILCVLLFCFLRHRKAEKSQNTTKEINGGNEYQIEGATQFDLGTMKAATENFSPRNKLGQGGFGVVYKGMLQNGQEVAIKRLSQESKQGIKEFVNEVELVVKLQHRNLVRLVGFCTEAEERLVIYEFMPKLSLDRYLFDPSKSKYLPWETRYNIIEGIARGLHYLHEDSRHKVVHRDLKSKIADFGIAKHVVVDQTQGNNTTKITGTRGYMAPEYALAGQFSVKSDVFSFGVILLEIVWKRWTEGGLRNTVSRMEVGRCIQIGLLCVQYDPVSRPTMHAVLLMLNSRGMELPSPSAPSPFVHGTTMNRLRESEGQHTGSEISTSAWSMEKDLYPR